MPERTNEEDDRRSSPRFLCGGQVKISCLPSDGIVFPGNIRDLGLGGCCVDTTLPIDHGVRTEIVVRVNAALFRVVGEVRAIRGGSAACVEFVHLSAGGKAILVDLVRELARLQTVMNKLRSDRREMDAESFRRQLENRKLQAAMLSGRFRFLGTNPEAESSGESWEASSGGDQPTSGGKDVIGEGQPLVIPVDLFG